MLPTRPAAFRAILALLTLPTLLFALQDTHSTQPSSYPAAAAPSAPAAALVETEPTRFPDIDALLARIPETDGWESEEVRTFVKKLTTPKSRPSAPACAPNRCPFSSTASPR